MNPNKPMQPELLESLRARLRDAELEQYAADLLPRARLAFELRLDGPSSGERGESRWGGAPDVPAAFEWPSCGATPMGFLAQIRLADLIEDAQNPFPRRGLLLLFADMTDHTPHVVLVEDGIALQLAEVPQGETDWDKMAPHRLKIVPRADLPQWATSDYEEATQNMSDDDQDAYGDNFNLHESAGQSQGEFVGHLLGHAAGIGIDPREDAFVVREHDPAWLYNSEKRGQLDLSGAKKWQNLAVFVPVMSLDFEIADAGYFGFLIHEDDLKRLDFSRVYAHLQSS